MTPSRYRGKVSHCRIRVRQEGDSTRYWLKDNDSFDTLYALIEHYKQFPILSQVRIRREERRKVETYVQELE